MIIVDFGYFLESQKRKQTIFVLLGSILLNLSYVESLEDILTWYFNAYLFWFQLRSLQTYSDTDMDELRQDYARIIVDGMLMSLYWTMMR